jgi:hypothetical protein
MTEKITLSEPAKKALQLLASSGDWQSATTVHGQTLKSLAAKKLVSLATKQGDERVRISARGRKAIEAQA